MYFVNLTYQRLPPPFQVALWLLPLAAAKALGVGLLPWW
jgi:hypothetical protein